MELIANYNHSLSKAVGDSEIILLSLSELQFVETPGKSGSVRVSVLVSRTLLGTEREKGLTYMEFWDIQSFGWTFDPS